MDDLSPAFAAESLTANIIEELRERLESTDNYTKQLGLITEMEEKYNLEEGILLSHHHPGCSSSLPVDGELPSHYNQLRIVKLRKRRKE
jgi:hypothetical protein